MREKNRYISNYGLSSYDASVLTADRAISDYFDTVINSDKQLKESAKLISNWISTELFSFIK